MPPTATDPTLGAIVEVPVGRGVVRFCGATSFAAGKWIGIELSQPNGKNDGSVQGVKYFSCKPNYGVFYRPSQVKVVSATPEPSVSESNPMQIVHLPQHAHRHPRRGPLVTSVREACRVLLHRVLCHPHVQEALPNPLRRVMAMATRSSRPHVQRRRVSGLPRSVNP